MITTPYTDNTIIQCCVHAFLDRFKTEPNAEEIDNFKRRLVDLNEIDRDKVVELALTELCYEQLVQAERERQKQEQMGVALSNIDNQNNPYKIRAIARAKEMLQVKNNKAVLNALAKKYITELLEDNSIPDREFVATLKLWLCEYSLPFAPDDIESFDAVHQRITEFMKDFQKKYPLLEPLTDGLMSCVFTTEE